MFSDIFKEIDHEELLIKRYTNNLHELERQAANFSVSTVPVNIQNEIREEKKRIENCQHRLTLLRSKLNISHQNINAFEAVVLSFKEDIIFLKQRIQDLSTKITSSFGSDNVISIDNIKHIKLIRKIDATINYNNKTFTPFEWHPSGEIIAIVEWHYVSFHDRSGYEIHKIEMDISTDIDEDKDTPVQYMKWSPDGCTFIIRDWEGMLYFWGFDSKK